MRRLSHTPHRADWVHEGGSLTRHIKDWVHEGGSLTRHIKDWVHETALSHATSRSWSLRAE